VSLWAPDVLGCGCCDDLRRLWRGVNVRAATFRKVGTMGYGVCYGAVRCDCDRLPCSDSVAERLRPCVSMQVRWESVWCDVVAMQDGVDER